MIESRVRAVTGLIIGMTLGVFFGMDQVINMGSILRQSAYSVYS